MFFSAEDVHRTEGIFKYLEISAGSVGEDIDSYALTENRKLSGDRTYSYVDSPLSLSALTR